MGASVTLAAMRAIAGGMRARVRAARVCTLVLLVVIIALLELSLRRRGERDDARRGDHVSPGERRRRLVQFNNVGNVLNAGIGGFPNTIYRPAPLWPTSCFAVGNYGLWSLAQCVMFTGTF